MSYRTTEAVGYPKERSVSVASEIVCWLRYPHRDLSQWVGQESRKEDPRCIILLLNQRQLTEKNHAVYGLPGGVLRFNSDTSRFLQPFVDTDVRSEVMRIPCVKDVNALLAEILSAGAEIMEQPSDGLNRKLKVELSEQGGVDLHRASHGIMNAIFNFDPKWVTANGIIDENPTPCILPESISEHGEIHRLAFLFYQNRNSVLPFEAANFIIDHASYLPDWLAADTIVTNKPFLLVPVPFLPGLKLQFYGDSGYHDVVFLPNVSFGVPDSLANQYKERRHKYD